LFVFQVEISTDIFIVALSNFTLFSKPLWYWCSKNILNIWQVFLMLFVVQVKY
jgi:hypothetical protein